VLPLTILAFSKVAPAGIDLSEAVVEVLRDDLSEELDDKAEGAVEFPVKCSAASGGTGGVEDTEDPIRALFVACSAWPADNSFGWQRGGGVIPEMHTGTGDGIPA